MSNPDSLETIIANAKRQIEARMTLLLTSLEDAPANPAVKPLGGRAFTIGSTELLSSGTWDVFYHDWAAQYAAIKGHLENAFQQQSALTALQSILDTGKERVVSQHVTRTYSPAIISVVRPIIAEAVEGLKLWYGTQPVSAPSIPGPGSP